MKDRKMVGNIKIHPATFPTYWDIQNILTMLLVFFHKTVYGQRIQEVYYNI